MKALYLTRLNVPIAHEHVFIRQVWDELRKYDGVQCLEVLRSADGRQSLDYDPDTKVWTALVPAASFTGEANQTETFFEIFRSIKPDILHSNMHEGTEIVAARRLSIPVVTTIHIGCIICMKQDVYLCTSEDELCDGVIGEKCIPCSCDELPFPFVTKALLKVLPKWLESRLNDFFTRHHTFYFSRLFSLRGCLDNRKGYLETLRYAHPIAANRRLYDMLKYHGCKPILLPHGCRERDRLPYPTVDGKVKFFYIGRINRQKGLHVFLDALQGIDKSLYELHVIGEANASRLSMLYFKSVMRRLKTVNCFFHGAVKNEDLEQYVKDWHVMIHPAIYHEVYGLTVAESLVWGRPVLATRCCGPEMQIHDGVDGWLVPTNDAVALRRKIEEIIRNRSGLVAMSEQCRLPMAMPDYTRQVYAIYNKVYEEEKK